MRINTARFLTDPIVLIFLASVTGLLLGQLKIGIFKLGKSGSLFSGLLIGWVVYYLYALPYLNDSSAPAYARRILERGVVSQDYFNISLILFIAASALLAAKGFGYIIRKYGIRFLLLGFFMTFIGALLSYASVFIFTAQNSFAIAGTYNGALTSSVGLAAALEVVENFPAASSMIGFGYAVGYAPGVIMVILLIQSCPSIFHLNLDSERALFLEDIRASGIDPEGETCGMSLDMLSFGLVCLGGFMVGSIEIYLGPTLGFISLGMTGGIVITALVLGYIGRIGPVTFRFSDNMLEVIREIGMMFFLAVVGLRSGYDTLVSLTGAGLTLVLISSATAALTVLAGYTLGRYVFRINWFMLAGALCGGMTSTPGLSAAIDSYKNNQIAAGYGAAYPTALLGMILFNKLMFNLLLPLLG
jgi:putative transport protein